jgi:hypothetical protein
VKYSRGFKFLLAAALVSTLGFKLLLRPATSGENPTTAAQTKLADFLTRQHFRVSIVEHAAEGQPSIVAAAGVCRILAVRSTPMGSDRDLIRRQASPSDEVFILYRGKIYEEQPTWRTVPDFLWARILRELGVASADKPVYAIISPRNCNASVLPWDELAIAVGTSATLGFGISASSRLT